MGRDLTMPQFILKIDLGNDAINPDGQYIGCLERVVKDILNNGTQVPREIRDINGNVVGHYEVTE